MTVGELKQTQINQNQTSPTSPASSIQPVSTAVANTTNNNNSSSTLTNSPIELTENFNINNKRKSNVKIQVKLSGAGIYLRRETEQQNNINEQLIRIEDIIGSRCGPRLKKRPRGGLSSCKRNLNDADEQQNENSTSTSELEAQKDTSAYLYIYAYIKSEKSNLVRNRTVRILRFRSYERFEENLKLAERWYRAIRVNKRYVCSGGMAAALDFSELNYQPKPLLILLNPKSGSGKGRELFQKQVAPILKEAEIHYDLQITTHANYARNFVKCRKDLTESYSGIVVASGDGLFYEVLNGLMERTDWQAVCRQLPIGIIPCGSGNGLAASIAHLYNEPYEPKPIMHAALTCVSGSSAPMDIVRVELMKSGGGEKQQKPVEMYSFLSIGWGLIADIDIESERLRSIGAQRFTLWSIRRLISLRTYKGKLSYLPWQAKANELKAMVTQNEAEREERQQTNRAAKLNDSEFQDVNEDEDELEAQDAILCQSNNVDDDEFFADAISLDRTSFRPHIDSWHSATSRRTAYYSVAGQSIRSRKSILEKLEIMNAAYEQQRLPASSTSPSSSASTSSSVLPPLHMPLPDNWLCEDGEFIMVHAAYTTHLAADCLFAPASRLNDGIIYLVIIRAGCARSQLLQFLLGLSTGTHIPETPNEFIQVIPVRAFRIEPYNSDGNAAGAGDEGIMAVDGERVDYGVLQAEMLPGMINVMVPNGK